MKLKCRFDIFGKKSWVDSGSDARPETIDIVLYRDNVEFKRATLDSHGDGEYRFPCLIIWKNASEKYIYRVDEVDVIQGYRKIIKGYDVLNVQEVVEINGLKIWDDNFDQAGQRPGEVYLQLLQNGIEIESITVLSPASEEDRVSFTFGEKAFADDEGVPYVYTVTETAVNDYRSVIDNFTVTNIYDPITP